MFIMHTMSTTEPHNLHTLLHILTTNRQLRQTYRLDIPTTRLRNYGNKRFSWRGATLWNNFPNPYAKKISQSPLSNINSRSYSNVPH